MPDLAGYRALVTGASSGIGAEMARILGGWGADLVLVARRAERLESLASEIRDGGRDVVCIAQDLATPSGAAELLAALDDGGHTIDILINNAGFGDFQAVAHQEWETNRSMLQLNVVAVVELTHKLLPAMLASDRRGYILNVASIAAYQPVPYMANYAATKAYVRMFTESLVYELEGTNVSASCLCPGGTRTEFFEVSGQHNLGTLAKSSLIDADVVAEKALKAMLRRKRNLVTGLINKINCFLLRFIPRGVAARAAGLVLGKPAEPKQLTEKASS